MMTKNPQFKTLKVLLSDYYIPFEIQSEIMKRLPMKSLLQFRSVSKHWKAFIDSPEFIKTYHMNHPNPRHHLLLEYDLVPTITYTSIVDDNTFPQQKFPLTAPEPLNLLKYRKILSSVDGLVCFYGLYKDIGLETWMVVLWNPCVKKCVGIPIPNVFDDSPQGYTCIGFGVCPDTNDPKLVKINVVHTPSRSRCWEVQVFTLSSRVWRTVYTGAPVNSCYLSLHHVFIDGIIYWGSWGSYGPPGCCITSFDLKSEKFGEVSIPDRFLPDGVCVEKVYESLGFLEYYDGMSICGVWMRKDGVNKPFSKMYTVKVEGKSMFNTVLGFRNNGEVVLQLDDDDDDDFDASQIKVYEPSSGRINSVGISGRPLAFSACSYMETLLLLDQSNTIIH